MNKIEFLSALREKLQEELSQAQIQGHIRYYDNYISQEIQSGKNEEEVIAALGDPTLLARTILETPGNGNSDYGTYYNSEETGTPTKTQFYDDEENSGQSDPYMQLKTVSPWGCFGIAIVGILILIVILSFVGVVLNAVLPVLFPVVLILLIISIIRSRK